MTKLTCSFRFFRNESKNLVYHTHRRQTVEYTRLEVFMAVRIQVEVFCVVMPCSVKSVRFTETSVSYHITTTQKTSIWIVEYIFVSCCTKKENL